MRAQQPRETAVSLRWIVNFVATPGAGIHDPVPQRREQAAAWSGTKSIGAFATEADRSGRRPNAAGLQEHREKFDLAVDRPAVAADPGIGTGRSCRARRGHRPAWTTNAPL